MGQVNEATLKLSAKSGIKNYPWTTAVQTKLA